MHLIDTHKVRQRRFYVNQPTEGIMAAKKQLAERQGKVFGYARISTDKQDADRQEKDIYEYAAKHGMVAPTITVEKISSRKEDRQVFGLIDRLESGDILIVTELSRLARSMIELNGMIAEVIRRGASIHVITGKPVDSSIESQCMVFAIGIAAQVERDMISERTKSALKARKADGVKLGRPPGRGVEVDKALRVKGWTADYLLDLKKAGLSDAKIAKLVGVDARTMGAWLAKAGTPNKGAETYVKFVREKLFAAMIAKQPATKQAAAALVVEVLKRRPVDADKLASKVIDKLALDKLVLRNGDSLEWRPSLES
jgi:putative DNA-invertase from lambdoid prophage Rac